MGLLEIATRLIETHGESATLKIPGDRVPDGGGGSTAGVPVEIPVRIVSIVDGTELKQVTPFVVGLENHAVLLSTKGLTHVPEINDLIEIRDETKAIKKISEVFLKREHVFFELVLRNE